jgi:translation initiation factor IF-2
MPKPKSVAEMTPEEYFQYLADAQDAEFMKIVAHDVKKVVSVVHGYISLMRLDIEEGTLDAAQLENYLNEMEDMLQKSYVYIDAAEDVYDDKGD